MSDVEVPTGGTSLTTPAASTVRLSLEEPVTGHTWIVATVSGGLTVDGDSFVPNASGAPGAAARRTFTVTAQASGELVLELRRPWESAATEERTVHVDVTG